MKIEAIWAELEQEADVGASAAWLTRFALPTPSANLLIALETAPRRRTLLLPVSESAIPHKYEWPTCRGLEIFGISLGGKHHLGVRLMDRACTDVFTVLAEDVAPRVTAAPDPKAAASALLGRLRRWQKFLSAGANGLTADQQKGLFGELYACRGLLIPALDGFRAVSGWRAPHATHQDFQFGAAAVEVKTTSAKQPTSVRITNERQLDTVGVGALFLYVLVLDEREAGEGITPSGENLPGLVQSVRSLLKDDALEIFDDRLLDWSYFEADVSRYEGRRFAMRQQHVFLISDEFPRLTERMLPGGIGDVSYALSLDACEPFRVTLEQMIGTLKALVT